MKASEFANKAKDIATNYKTLYVMGCFGSPMTASNKKRFTTNHDYNREATRTKMINSASADTFGFDCVGLIKGILWNWDGSKTKTHGGATYKKNGVPDANANEMIKLCEEVSTNFTKIDIGEVVWKDGHIGVYVGNGLAVECTPTWKNKVQVTAVKNIGEKSGYNSRKWTKHGKLPYVDYQAKETAKPISSNKVDPAQKRNDSLAGKYIVTAAGLNVRAGAGTNKTSLAVLKRGTTVTNYGYYNETSGGNKWLYVQLDNGLVGYCSLRYLSKK